MEITRYVAGFMFNACYNEVLLVRKQRPAWQKGKLNGVGGHIEHGENEWQAMAREFLEETGISTTYSAWNRFCEMDGANNDSSPFSVTFFWACSANLGHFESRDEPLEIVALEKLHSLRGDTIGNVPWLIAAARDHATGVHPPTKIAVKY